jgi:mRNA interferase HigB
MISYKHIREFVIKHPDSKVSLGRWYKRIKKGRFTDQSKLKRMFSGVDYIGNDRFVFNISGNKYRLVAVIILSTQIVLIRFIGPHAEYNTINALNI